jgi:biopolymer transport protein ExbD
MVATVFKDSTRRLDVQLPESHSGEASGTRLVTIEMATDGNISMNGALVSMAELETRLQPAGDANGPQSVIIRADRRLECGKVVEVMGLCQASGVADIAVTVK